MLENLNFKQLYQNIKYQFNNEDLIKEALTHPSLSRNKGIVNYQRLEFLGDKVISFVIAEFLIKKVNSTYFSIFKLIKRNTVVMIVKNIV